MKVGKIIWRNGLWLGISTLCSVLISQSMIMGTDVIGKQMDALLSKVTSDVAEVERFVTGTLPNLINGSNLSGGERQRIALARAFIRKAPILLMDEATSALDNNNETEIQASIARLICGKTALVVAHRNITIDFCEERYCL